MAESLIGGNIVESSVNKPPLGVVPEDIYKAKRLKELSRAIFEYVHKKHYDGTDATVVIKWCGELIRRLKEFENE